MTRGKQAGRARRRRSRWAGVIGVLTVAAIAAYAVNAIAFEIDPGNWWGLTYGTGAAVLMTGAVLLAWRRRAMRLASRLRLGSARSWLGFHLYGGSLAMLLTLMHTGFRFPTGLVTTWLFWLSVATVASGFIGLTLQRWLPRVLASGLNTEVNYERIPELVTELRERSEKIAADASDPIRALYDGAVAPMLKAPTRRLSCFYDVTSGSVGRLNEFSYIRRFLPAEERTKLDELELLFRTKLEADAHYTLQSALRFWLWSHVPVSMLLMGFLAVHLFAVYYW